MTNFYYKVVLFSYFVFAVLIFVQISDSPGLVRIAFGIRDPLFDECMNLFNSREYSKAILMATSYFSQEYPEANRVKCSSSCLFLPSYCRKYPEILSKVDAFVFHALRGDLVPAVKDFRKFNFNKDQLRVFWSLESPLTMAKLEKSSMFWKSLDNFFNVTATYRRDSDVYIPAVGFRGVGKKQVDANSSTFSVNRQHRRHIAAIISNCDAASGRLKFLEDLSKLGLSVDVYGRCSPNGLSCDDKETRWHDARHCMVKKLEGRYYFFAAFENAKCRDYVTEKFFWSLDYDIVPLVLGGTDYSLISPPTSFVNVADFERIVDLAYYIEKISSDFHAYTSYMAWKNQFQMIFDDDSQPVCLICKKMIELHGRMKPKTVNITRWWADPSQCQT